MSTLASFLLLPQSIQGFRSFHDDMVDLWTAKDCCGMTDKALQHLEVSPQGMALAGEMAARVARSGGAALIVDYGRNTPYGNSLQVLLLAKTSPFLTMPADLAGAPLVVATYPCRCLLSMLCAFVLNRPFATMVLWTCCHSQVWPTSVLVLTSARSGLSLPSQTPEPFWGTDGRAKHLV